MRIRRFSEARGIFQEDEISFEPFIYCFGGPGDDGGSSDIGDAQDEEEGQYDFSPSRSQVASAAGVSSDTIVGSGPSGQGVVRSGSGSPVTSGRSVQEEAERQGVSTSEIVDRINAADAAARVGSGTADDVFGYNDPFESEQFPGSTIDIPEFDEPAGAISMYGIPGVTPPGMSDITSDYYDSRYYSGPQTQAGAGLTTSDYILADPSSDFPTGGGMVRADGRDLIQGTRTDFAGAEAIAAARQRAREKGIDISGMGPGGISSPTGSMGVRDLDIVFDPTDFNLGIPAPRTEAERQAAFAALRGTPLAQQVQEARGMDTKDSTQAERAAAAAAIAAGTLTADDVANRVAGGAGVSTRPGEKAGESVLSMSGKEYTFDNTLPGDQRVYSPVQAAAGITAARDITEEEPIAGAIDVQSIIDEARAKSQQGISAGQTTPSTAQGLASMPGYTGPNAMQQGMANITAMNNLSAQATQESLMSPVQPTPGMQLIADVVNAVDMYGGGNMPAYMENVAQRPGGTPVMSQGPMMSYTPESLQPTALQQAMMEGSAGQAVGPYSPAQGSQEVIGAVGPNKLGFLPGQSDLVYVGSPAGYETLGGQSSGIEYTQPGASTGATTDQSGGDDQQVTMPQEVAPVAPKTCPDGYIYDEASDSCVYQGVARVQPYQYTASTRTPYNYTGLPSLAPVSLKPSFQASGNYGPLYNFR